MKPIHDDLGSELSGELIAAAIEVHREFGPGLNKEDYQQALSVELTARGVEHECQVALPLVYKGIQLDCGYRMDLVVARNLLVELKAVERRHPIHEAQLITYLRLSGFHLGLLVNFGAVMLRDGIVRRANSSSGVPAAFEHRSGDSVFDPESEQIVEAALEVQHVLGMGLLRSAYEAALAHELGLRGFRVERRLPVHLIYREQRILSAKEVPMVVEGRWMIGCVCAKEMDAAMVARQRSLLKASNAEEGLCFNFHSPAMSTEIKRIHHLKSKSLHRRD